MRNHHPEWGGARERHEGPHRHHPFEPGMPGARGRGPGGPRGRRGGGRGRVPRGEVRAAVLLLLAEEPMNGYQLMQTIADRSGGRWTPSPGAIYPTLNQLEDEGRRRHHDAGEAAGPPHRGAPAIASSSAAEVWRQSSI